MSVSAYIIAAICGNWRVESTMNPGVWESLIPSTFDHEYQYDAIGGYGLGQWTNVGTPYGRLWNLHQWVTSHGFADGDGNGQCAYVLIENNGVGVWYNSPDKRGNYTTFEEFLASTSTNLADLVWDFMVCWEGIENSSYSDRLDAAQDFLSYIQSHANDDPQSFSWTSTNNYLGWNDMRENVMCVYFFFNGYVPPTPPTPPTPTTRKGMPLWMMLKYGL